MTEIMRRYNNMGNTLGDTYCTDVHVGTVLLLLHSLLTLQNLT